MPLGRTTGTVLLLIGILLGCAILAAGCAQVDEGNLTVNAAIEPCNSSPRNGSGLLLAEAERELARMNSSAYSHKTIVDEENGIYQYDCSGFVGYALKRADPCAFGALHDDRPDTGDFYSHITGSGPVPGNAGWMQILSPRELRPGDLIVWPRDRSDEGSSGHIMIIAGFPEENPDRNGELLVRVIDSTTSRHAKDTRSTGEQGLGEGTVGIMTDPSGLPVGYFWRGGESRSLQEMEMAFARIL